MYTKHFNTKKTVQSQSIPGRSQIKNDAGGFVFESSSWDRFNRFLILGSEGGCYYNSEQKLTVENAKNVIAVIQKDGLKAVKEIVNVSVEARAPKNDAAIFALALACTFGDQATKQAAYSAIKQVCRIGTHLFTFCQAVQDLRGWSRGLRNGVAGFYTNKSADQVAYQAIKYRQRNGWTHQDVLRLCHAQPVGTNMDTAFKFMTGKKTDGQWHPLLNAFEQVQALGTTDVKTSIQLIKEYNLPWEAIPTELLKNKNVWSALLEDMPVNAMVRNLGKMTNIGLLTSNFDNSVKTVKETLGNLDKLKKSKIHPMQLLIALKTYEQGRGDKGKLTWSPVQSVVDALDEAFYLSFGTITPTGKNTLVAVDFSGSMHSGSVAGTSLTPVQASVALALVTLNTEPNCVIIGFDQDAYKTKYNKRMRLDEALRATPQHGHGTDASVPFRAAAAQKYNVDTFISLTDNQTWAGQIHPTQALDDYRKQAGVNSKSVNVAMVANQFTVSDPNDMNCLDVAGFDTGTQQVINAFVKG